MNEIFLIKEISELSFFLSVYNFVTVLIYEPKESFAVFLLAAASAFCVFTLRQKGKSWANLFLLIMLFPFLMIKSFYDIPYYCGICVFAVYTTFNRAHNSEYDEIRNRFGKQTAMIFIMLMFSIISSKSSLIEKESIPYSIIYLVSSVVLLRTLRYIKFNNKFKKMSQLNMYLAGAVTLVSLLAGIKELRQAALLFVSKTFNLVSDILFKVFYWVLFAIGYIVNAVNELMIKIFGNRDIPDITVGTGEVKHEIIYKKENLAVNLLELIRRNPLLNFTLKFIVFSLILYAVIRILKSKYKTSGEQETYKESKEKLNIENMRRRPGLMKGFSVWLKTGSAADQIRLYYKKYMLLSIKRNAGITNKDTTLEIKEKTVRHFSSELLDKMRDIYIKVRYGYYNADKKDLKEIQSMYDKIQNTKERTPKT